MKLHTLLLLALAAPSAASAADAYPTTDRVEFVLECMKDHPERSDYEMLYKCSCAIDAIAEQMSYDEYLEGASSARYQGMGGERAGLFRDAESAKQAAKRYRGTREAAFKKCYVE